MSLIISLISPSHYFYYPLSSAGWLVWLSLLAIVSYLAWRWRHHHARWGSRQGFILTILIPIVPITSILFGISLPPGEALPYPHIAIEPEGAVIMVFAALPWMLAARYLGPAPAGLLAAFSGALIGYWDTHSLFTPLEYALIAVVFSVAVRQKYRTPAYRFLRRPIIATIVVSLSYPIIYSILNITTVGDSIAVGLDFVSSRLGLMTAAVTGQLIVGGLIVEAIEIGWRKDWVEQDKHQPSPSEISLENRILFLLGPAITVLFSGFIVGVWIVAGNTAENMIKDQMEYTVGVAAESIPFILETGQNLVSTISEDERLLSSSVDEIERALQENLNVVPYFQQLYLLDNAGLPITGYPNADFQALELSVEEKFGIVLALQGVSIQIYGVPPAEGGNAAQISFMAVVNDNDGNNAGILLARSGLASNPFTRPLLEGLDRLKSLNGEGYLLDENGIILYQSTSDLVMTKYPGILNEAPTFNDETGIDGTRHMTYNRRASGRSWSVVATIPTQQVQQQALYVTAPLLGMLLLLAIIIYGLLRFSLGTITKSLQVLAVQSKRIAAGDLDQHITSDSSDEIGLLGIAFEDMRVNLKARFEEINRLLFISQGITFSLDLDTAIKPVLEAALDGGAASVRLVFATSALPEFEEDTLKNFGVGSETESYAVLDDQVAQLNQQQELVVLSNPTRAGLKIPSTSTSPGALLAVALQHDGKFFGSFWIAYQDPHIFSEEETRFAASLAGQAALAAAKARLFHSAKIGRQRLEAVITSTTNPVLVTDQQDRLLIANPAAMDLLTNGIRPELGMAIEKVVPQKELLDILLSSKNTPATAEVSFPNNRVYIASASQVTEDGQLVGRVCILCEITYLKKLDALKTEFVDTVSLDLRSPLKIMRGYANMVGTVGDLNKQQTGYMSKIAEGVDSMSGLVKNLLDIGRIEAGVGLYLEKVQIIEIAEQVIDDFRNRADQKDLKLSLESPQTPIPLVEADRALLEQAIRNMMENAINFTNRAGKINLLISSQQDGVLLSLADDGVGVAPIDQPRIFERFFTVDQSSQASKRNSSGLGLAIVKSIAEQHGGKVWLESQLGSGSTFHLLIPYQQPKV